MSGSGAPRLEVIGAGFGRTGTQSLQRALELLGYDRCYHMDELNRRPDDLAEWQRALDGGRPRWDKVFDGYRAAVDWPTCTFWPELRAWCPDARVILTVRPFDDWYHSMRRTVVPLTTAALEQADGEALRQVRFGDELIFGHTFGRRFDEPDFVRARFEAHNQAVVDAVPADQLLVFGPGDGWGPLCRFLGRDIPTAAYPHSNRGDEFGRRVLGVD